MLQAMDPVIICDPTSDIDNTLPLYWWYSPFGGWMYTKFEREDYTNADAKGHSQESI